VLSQSCEDYEWLVQDGGSGDGTLEYLASVDCADTVSTPDAGLYDAMNKAIERASGDYIIFINAGDCFAAADILLHIQQEIEKSGQPPDFIYGDALEDTGHGRSYYKKARKHTEIASGLFTHHQAMVYKRESLGDIRYDTRYKIAADFDFTVRFLENVNGRKLYIQRALCVFKFGGISQKNAALGRQEEKFIKMQHKLCPLWTIWLAEWRQIIALMIRRSCAPVYFWLRRFVA
jgi:putative colanic acid biosynthesis glycosyltransferase